MACQNSVYNYNVSRKQNLLNIQIKTYHYDKDANKDSDEVSKECECMLDVIQISKVSLLNDFLGVNHHVPNKYQESKIQLQNISTYDYLSWMRRMPIYC